MDQMLLQANEAAKVVAIPLSSFYRLLRRGDVPCVRLGRSVRIPADAFRQWVEERAGATTVLK